MAGVSRWSARKLQWAVFVLLVLVLCFSTLRYWNRRPQEFPLWFEIPLCEVTTATASDDTVSASAGGTATLESNAPCSNCNRFAAFYDATLQQDVAMAGTGSVCPSQLQETAQTQLDFPMYKQHFMDDLPYQVLVFTDPSVTLLEFSMDIIAGTSTHVLAYRSTAAAAGTNNADVVDPLAELFAEDVEQAAVEAVRGRMLKGGGGTGGSRRYRSRFGTSRFFSRPKRQRTDLGWKADDAYATVFDPLIVNVFSLNGMGTERGGVLSYLPYSQKVTLRCHPLPHDAFCTS